MWMLSLGIRITESPHGQIPLMNCQEISGIFWQHGWRLSSSFRWKKKGSTQLVSKQNVNNMLFQLILWINSLSLQNVVMLMSDLVDWLIPDIPKDISLQIHKEKNLIVELFMKEEQGKRLMGKRKSNPSPQSRSRPTSHVQINNH